MWYLCTIRNIKGEVVVDVTYINPFLQATEQVIKQMVATEMTIGKLTLTTPPIIGKDISIFIGVAGEIKGFVAFTLEKQSALSLSSAMMGGYPVSELNELCKSAVGELANMILGNASTILAGQGTRVDITPPAIIEGNDMRISQKLSRVIVIPLEVNNIGIIEVNLGLEKSA